MNESSGSRRTPVFFVVLGLAYALAQGCRSAICDHAESHCADAHTVEICGGSVDAIGATLRSRTATCSGATPFCVDTSSGGASAATCAASATKAAECAAAPNGQQCLAGRPVTCENGYLFSGGQCSVGQVCVESLSGDAFCALSASPDPSCAQIDQQYHCEGDVSVHCFQGYRLADFVCPGGCDPAFGECDPATRGADAGQDAG